VWAVEKKVVLETGVAVVNLDRSIDGQR